MLKQAIVHYPSEEKALRFIAKEIAAFHCAAAVKYMDTLNLNNRQKITVIDSLLQDMAVEQQTTA